MANRKSKKQSTTVGKRKEVSGGAAVGQGMHGDNQADTQITIRPVVEAPGFMPFVKVRLGTWRGLLEPGQALEVGKHLQEAALGAQYDALLYRYLLHDHEDDPRYHETATRIVDGFRRWRAGTRKEVQAAEPTPEGPEDQDITRAIEEGPKDHEMA